MKKSLSVVAAILVLLIPAISDGVAGQAMNAEFRTMSECLAGIRSSSGQSLKVVTDTPSEVSGFLSKGQGFACQRKESGTKGTYYHGWYTVE